MKNEDSSTKKDSEKNPDDKDDSNNFQEKFEDEFGSNQFEEEMPQSHKKILNSFQSNLKTQVTNRPEKKQKKKPTGINLESAMIRQFENAVYSQCQTNQNLKEPLLDRATLNNGFLKHNSNVNWEKISVISNYLQELYQDPDLGSIHSVQLNDDMDLENNASDTHEMEIESNESWDEQTPERNPPEKDEKVNSGDEYSDMRRKAYPKIQNVISITGFTIEPHKEQILKLTSNKKTRTLFVNEFHGVVRDFEYDSQHNIIRTKVAPDSFRIYYKEKDDVHNIFLVLRITEFEVHINRYNSEKRFDTRHRYYRTDKKNFPQDYALIKYLGQGDLLKGSLVFMSELNDA